MSDENPYAVGPPPDYDPPPIDDLRDPEWRTQTHARGRALVLAIMAELGHHRTENGKWTREE
jgi:hypothetical protein